MQRITLEEASSLIAGKRKGTTTTTATPRRKKRKAPKGSQRDLINRLFRQGGPLYGKKRVDYAIAKVHPDGINFDLVRYVRNKNKKEENMIIALIRTLGWPAESESVRPDTSNPEMVVKVDALYPDLGLVFECDEMQHYDDDHLFNQGDKQGYQKRRDRLVNEYYTSRGFYVVRLNGTRGPYRIDPAKPDQARRHPSGLLWYPAENSEVLRRGREAVKRVLELKTAAYARGDFAGKLISYPDDAVGAFARRWFDADTINAQASLVAEQSFDEVMRAKLRGTLEAMRISMAQTASRLETQPHQPDVLADGDSDDDSSSSDEEEEVVAAEEEDAGGSPLLPTAAPIGSGLEDMFRRVLQVGNQVIDGEEPITEYERFWQEIMRRHSPESKYQQRLQLIDSERAAFAARGIHVQ